jgi:hypothetical protein
LWCRPERNQPGALCLSLVWGNSRKAPLARSSTHFYSAIVCAPVGERYGRER